MTKLLQLFSLLFLSFSTFGCLGELTSDNWDFSTEQHAWGPKSPKKADYHWPSDNLTPGVLDNNTTSYDAAGTISDWSLLGTPIQAVEVGDLDPYQIEMFEDGTNTDSWIGLARIWLDGSHITRGEVVMNTAMINARFLHLPNLPQHVLCQEFGHILGLGHVHDRLDTCMNDCTTATTRAEWEACIDHPDGTTPNDHDAETLNASYDGHEDSVSGGGGDGGGGGGGPCDKNPNHPLCQDAPTLVFTFPAP